MVPAPDLNLSLQGHYAEATLFRAWVWGRSVAHRFLFNTALIFSCAICLSGCARPKDDNIKAFANATSALTTFAKSTGDLNVEVDGKIKLALAAHEAIKGESATIKVQKSILLTGKSDADWKAVTGFLDAISAYATALSAANDPGLETGLGDKVTSIGSAIAKVDTAIALTDSPDRITAISNVVGQLVTVATNLYASHQIHEAMGRAQNALDNGAASLQSAVHFVYNNTQRKLDRYQNLLQCKGAIVASGPEESGRPDKLKDVKEFCRGRFPRTFDAAITPASSLERYNNFVASEQELSGLQARLAALQNVGESIGAMIEAHRKMMIDLDDKTALLDFLKSVGTIADNLAKVEAAKSS
jgi:hypothetical protein